MKPIKQGGRPREFDPEAALAAATAMFWRHGYSNTTVDRVAKTMNMSKPSVYAAFGTKEELYCESLKIFCDGLVGAVVACELSDESLADVLVNLFEREIDFYCQEDPPRGCFLVCTAPAETANCDAIREILSSTLRSIDGAFDRLHTLTSAFSPELGAARVLSRGACYRPVTSDGVPLIGRVPGVNGAYVATGHNVWGMLNAPATGEVMAELIADGEVTTVPIEPFNPSRLTPFDPHGNSTPFT